MQVMQLALVSVALLGLSITPSWTQSKDPTVIPTRTGQDAGAGTNVGSEGAVRQGQPGFTVPAVSQSQTQAGNNNAIPRSDPNRTQQSDQPFEPVQLPPREMTLEEIDVLRRSQVDRATGQILLPDEIGKIKDRVIDAHSAASRPWPTDVKDIKMFPLTEHVGHDHKPITITLAYGMISPIIFKDERGQPWPIESIAFDPRQFSQDGSGCGGGGSAPTNSEEEKITFNMMPCQFQTYGNISVKLRNHPTPFVMIIRSGRYAFVDSPVTLSVHGRSPYKSKFKAASPSKRKSPHRHTHKPKSKPKSVAGGVAYPDDLFDDFLAGVPPRGTRKVATGVNGVAGYLYRNRLYLVGDIRVLAPSFDATARAPGDRKSVFRIDRPVGRVLIADKDGFERPINIDF